MEIMIRSFEPSHRFIFKCLFFILASAIIFIAPADAGNYEILVLGDVDETIDVYKQADFWGQIDRSKPLDVPRAIIVVINKSWREEAKQVPVEVKKELFFRGLVPLVLYSNEPTVLIVGAENMADKAEVESEIESLRTSGELDEIIRSMRLKGD